MVASVEEMTALVESQMQQISDPVVHDALKALLVEPFLQVRDWFYGGEPEIVFPCWVVADDPESGTRYVYCEEGFGPVIPWGLVSMSGLEMGMDSGWFDTLERAFYDSFASIPLPIWNVVKRDADDVDRVIGSSLTDPEADALLKKITTEQGLPFNRIVYDIEPRTRKNWL